LHFKMRLLLLTTHLNPGGIPRYVLGLAKGLKMQGHTVWVASSGGSWCNQLQESGVPHKHIPIKTKSFLNPKVFFSLFALLGFIKREKIEIVHANNRVTQHLGFLIHRFSGIPYVSTFHGFYRPSLLRKLFKFEGDKTIAISKAVKSHLTQNLKIKEEKVRVVYNGIDQERFLPKTKDKEKYGFKKNDFLVGLLSRISAEKGHFLAVEAMQQLSVKYPDLYLVITGTGRLQEKLKKYVAQTGLENKIKFLAYPSEEILDILDLLVMPSQSEGFGFLIIEAFLKGVAVVGFNTGGIAEIIENKKNGLLFEHYESSSLKAAIEEMINNEGLGKQLAENAKKDALRFSLENMTLATEAVYLEAIKSRRKQ